MTSTPPGSDHRTQWLRRTLDARLQPPYLRMVSVALLVVAVAMLVVSFATSNRGTTYFGPPLGNDFAGFFVAAQILDRGEPARLYDRALHDELYHELLPNLEPGDSIPYVHPPFVAGLLKPFTRVPFEFAVAIWLTISASLYGVGVWLLLVTMPVLRREHSGLVLLIALSFEPFLMECWLGGQLSAIGFFSYALAWFALIRNRPVASGMALGLSFYKPTLLILMLPLLLVGRRWWMLLGMAITGFLLAGLSLAYVGWEASVGYLDVLLAFRKSTSGGGLGILTWKYVDLNNSLRLLCGGRSAIVTFAFVTLSIVPFAWLARCWWHWPRLDVNQQRWLWGATLAWLPVLNVYVGIYDSIFAVQSVLLAAGVLLDEHRSQAPLTDSSLAYWALAIWGSAWFSQGLARTIGVQVYTVALIGFGLFALQRASPKVTMGVSRDRTLRS